MDISARARSYPLYEYFFAPEGTHNTLITPPHSKESEKILKEDPEKMSDTCSQ